MASRTTTIGAALLALAGIWLACAGEEHPAPELAPAVAAAPPVNAHAEYVGQESCRDCHLSIYTSYERTGMGRSFSKMTADNTVGEFDGSPELTLGTLTYRMSQRGERFFMEEFVTDSDGTPRAVEEHELVWVVGSNNHGRTYLIEREGKLFQAPLCWYPMDTRWEFCPGYELKNDHFTREISKSCMYCHNGVMPLVAGERNQFETPYPHGIGCERCHGPGSLHVERWGSGEGFRNPDQPLQIINPRTLPQAERQQVCFQCHLGDAKQTERIIRHEREPESFRPGESINAIFVPFRYEQQTHVDFGLSAQADRMILSACYTESGGQLECTTCHDPHLPIAEQPEGYYNQRCASCHQPQDCTEDENARNANGDDCTSCHMRRAEPDDQRFSLFTDHWIRKEIDFEEKDHRDSFAIEPIFKGEYAKLDPSEQSYYKARALMQMSDMAPANRRVEMQDEAVTLFRDAIDKGYSTTDSHYYLGKLLVSLRKFDEAAAEFEAVLAQNANHRDALFALGQYYDAQGDKQRAIELFDRMLTNEPDLPIALAERGRMLFSQGDAVGAKEFFERAMQREPWNVTFVTNVGMAHAAQGDMQTAADYAKLAAKLNPDGKNVWEFNMNVLREIGDTKGSQEAAEHLKKSQY